MWSYSWQRQPPQRVRRRETTLPAMSWRHLSGCRPGTTSAFCQHKLLIFSSKIRILRDACPPLSFTCTSSGSTMGKSSMLSITLYDPVSHPEPKLASLAYHPEQKRNLATDHNSISTQRTPKRAEPKAWKPTQGNSEDWILGKAINFQWLHPTGIKDNDQSTAHLSSFFNKIAWNQRIVNFLAI